MHMAQQRTIFDRLRTMQPRKGEPLSALIARACDVGDGLIASLDPANVRKASELLNRDGHGLHGGLLILMADAQDRAISAALLNGNGDNGRKAA
jgi:hypothetical protein